jgi:hypothetical protein
MARVRLWEGAARRFLSFSGSTRYGPWAVARRCATLIPNRHSALTVHVHVIGVSLAPSPVEPRRAERAGGLAQLVHLQSTMKTFQTIGALSMMMGLLFACEHTENSTTAAPGTNAVRADPVGATNTQAVGADAAIVEKLSTARCDREQSCNNIGGGQKYVSREVCMQQMRGSLANDLNTYDCPHGIDRGQLEHCMLAIKNEECSNPLDTITRMQDCRTGALCMK